MNAATRIDHMSARYINPFIFLLSLGELDLIPVDFKQRADYTLDYTTFHSKALEWNVAK